MRTFGYLTLCAVAMIGIVTVAVLHPLAKVLDGRALERTRVFLLVETNYAVLLVWGILFVIVAVVCVVIGVRTGREEARGDELLKKRPDVRGILEKWTGGGDV